jgi:hypothetical protein
VLLNELFAFRKQSQYLYEGGNLSIGDKKADEIDLKVHNRTYMVKLLDKLLTDIDNAFKAKNKTPMWSPELLKSKTISAPLRSRLLTLLQNDANFNIMAGTSILRWLLERFSSPLTGGQLNKAMVAYNAGAYTRAISTGTKANKTPIDSTTLSRNPQVPAESRAYLLKMLGRDGFLSLIYKDKAI